MTRKYTVQVTEEDIVQGVRRDCNRCVIALAAARAGIPNPLVDKYDYDWCILSDHGFGPLPSAAAELAVAFDLGWPVRPMTFEVEIHDGGPAA